jgi:hypothetical protein
LSELLDKLVEIEIEAEFVQGGFNCQQYSRELFVKNKSKYYLK